MNTKLVRIKKETHEILTSLKIHPRETYDEVINRICVKFKEIKDE